MRRFLIQETENINDPVFIKGADAKHICNVLRMKPGDAIYLFDGTGFDYKAKIIDSSPVTVVVSLIERFPSRTESDLEIILAQAFLKDRKMDTLVRQTTELGVKSFTAFFSKRCAVNPVSKRLITRKERWEKISREALKQCGRGEIPEIHVAESFDSMLEHSTACDAKIVFWENESAPLCPERLAAQNKSIRRIFIVLGPEGGFTHDEAEKAKSSGFITASLGPRILKADTAALTACALIQYLLGDMGKSGKISLTNS
jgi:16S rRNA (uracil1498-N3)-methyltransferase